MSKYTKFDSKKQIPLSYNDNIRTSNRNWTRIEVALKPEMLSSLEISGQFPAFISSISNDKKICEVDLKVGDNIMAINGQNVSRACAKSVKKILKSSGAMMVTVSRPDQESLAKLIKKACQPATKQNKFTSIINLFKKNMGCMSLGLVKEPREMNKHAQVEETINYCYQIESQSTEIQKIDLSDCGYYSIPTSSKTSTISSAADLDSCNSTNFKPEIEDFLVQIQKAIDTYVRPCIMFKILTIDESLMLFQNIEKLIPVTKFLENMINSVENGSGWYSSLKIVFDAFKVYLTGLPNAINLLEELGISSEKFINFTENIGESCSFKIIDFLFLPLKFIQNVIDYLLQNDKITEHYCSEMRLHIHKTFAILEENVEDSITQVSNCSSIELESVSRFEAFEVMVKQDGYDEWTEGQYLTQTDQIQTSQVVIELGKIENFKQSKNVCILLVQTKDLKYFALKFTSEHDKDMFYQRAIQVRNN